MQDRRMDIKIDPRGSCEKFRVSFSESSITEAKSVYEKSLSFLEMLTLTSLSLSLPLNLSL